MKKRLTYNELIQRNSDLQSQVESLNQEVELLRKSFLPADSYYKDRFYKINENVNDVVYRFNLIERRYEYISPQIENLSGYTKKEFQDSPFIIRHLIHPEFITQYFKLWKKIFTGNIPDYFEIKIIKKDGEIRWVMQKNLLIRDARKKIVSIEGILTDITERKKADEALTESEVQKKAILNNLPHLAWLKDCDGVYLSVNESFASKINMSVDEIIGLKDSDIYPEKIAQRHRKEDLSVIKSKKQLYIEDKSEGIWETYKAPICNQEGEVIGVTGIALEISNRKKNEEEIKEYSKKLTVQNAKLKQVNDELKAAKENAEQADRLKSAFLANMSHEIRTPMNAILGFATLLRDRKLPENKQLDFINLINNNCRQLLHIISDIIDISKIEANQITVFNKNFNINKVLNVLRQNFEGHIKSLNKPIKVKTNYSLSDSNAQLYTDKVRLEQILSNLVSNAVKFTEKGEIVIGYEFDKDKSNVIFYVKDTGIGITDAEVKVIFERFRQVSSSYNKLYGGTGLGLSISKGLTKKLGGKIWVKSEIEQGSCFYVSLPYRKGVGTTVTKLPGVKSYDWAGKTILIAEDEETNYSLLENIISTTKAKVVWAKTGVEAVNYCKNNDNIDLVLMDLKMPDLNGLEATKIIKKFNKSLPIIAQTAFAMPNDEDNCLRAGCDDYLSKPLKIDNILRKINEFIHNMDALKSSSRNITTTD